MGNGLLDRHRRGTDGGKRDASIAEMLRGEGREAQPMTSS
jgi:hypothetical protein